MNGECWAKHKKVNNNFWEWPWPLKPIYDATPISTRETKKAQKRISVNTHNSYNSFYNTFLFIVFFYVISVCECVCRVVHLCDCVPQYLFASLYVLIQRASIQYDLAAAFRIVVSVIHRLRIVFAGCLSYRTCIHGTVYYFIPFATHSIAKTNACGITPSRLYSQLNRPLTLTHAASNPFFAHTHTHTQPNAQRNIGI